MTYQEIMKIIQESYTNDVTNLTVGYRIAISDITLKM